MRWPATREQVSRAFGWVTFGLVCVALGWCLVLWFTHPRG